MYDKIELINELFTTIKIMNPSINGATLSHKIEEVVSNYKIEKKTVSDTENDIMQKANVFLSSKSIEGLSLVTLKNYRLQLSSFSEHFNKSIEHITTSEIREYLASNSEWKVSTVSSKLSVLKSFFGWLVDEEILIKNPTVKIRLPKKEYRQPKALTVAELELVRESCNTIRKRALLEFMYATGARLSEVVGLNKEDVDLHNMSCSVIGKGNKERDVYLSHRAIYHLKKYLKSREGEEEALFVTQRKPYRRLKNRAIQREIEAVALESGIGKSISPHDLRRTLGMLTLDNGADIVAVQEILGHATSQTTALYAQISSDRKKEQYRKYMIQ